MDNNFVQQALKTGARCPAAKGKEGRGLEEFEALDSST